MREKPIQADIVLSLSEDGTRLFRNNVGQAVYVDRHGKKHRVVYGLCPGSSDLVGWHSITIRPEDVGRRIAVFVAIETKSTKGRATDEQGAFVSAVKAAGGFAGVARSVEDARDIVDPLQLPLIHPEAACPNP